MPTDENTRSAISFEHVVKRFGTHTVLDHLDIAIERGERVALIGPSVINGCYFIVLNVFDDVSW
ncbi:MAG: hypothetical protein OJJ55_09550, partial [Rhodococcus sp.]|nr:hypothetical protein [Rhodococcus sp. (in: high G+C Gram-positive bacteria)]